MSTQKAEHTPTPWRVRTHPDLGCFVEARIEGKPYGQEILGDDYFPELSREADCHFIVNACNEHDRLRKALELIANSNEFSGGTYIKELQQIARTALNTV